MKKIGADLNEKQAIKSGGAGVGNAKDNMEYIGRLMKMEKQLADEKRKTAQLEQQLIDSGNFFFFFKNQKINICLKNRKSRKSNS